MSCHSNPEELCQGSQNFSNKKSMGGKRSVLSFLRSCLSQLLCRLSAGAGCTDGGRFLHMLSTHPGTNTGLSIPPRSAGEVGKARLQTTAAMGEGQKISLEVAQLSLCQVFKYFQFGFKMLSGFIPLKRWHPRKRKTKVIVCWQNIPG